MFLALILGAVPVASADEVVLVDGSRLHGKILRMSQGKLQVETTYAGSLSIEKDQLVGVNSEAQMAVSLANGDRIIGRLVLVGDQQTVESASLGDVPIEVSSITAIFGPDSPTPRVRAAQSEFEAREAAIKQQHEKEMTAINARLARVTPIWTGRIQIGMTGRTGETERLTINSRIDVKRETQDDRLFLYTTVLYDREDGVRSDNQIIGGARLEIDLDESDRRFVYLRSELEFDEEENIDLRTTVTVGAGFVLVREDDFKLTFRGGIGYQHETYDDNTSDDQGVLELGYDIRWDINEDFRLVHDLNYIPEITASATDQFRIVSNTAIEMPIGTGDKWSIRTGVRSEYDNDPQEDIERLDSWFYMNLALDF